MQEIAMKQSENCVFCWEKRAVTTCPGRKHPNTLTLHMKIVTCVNMNNRNIHFLCWLLFRPQPCCPFGGDQTKLPVRRLNFFAHTWATRFRSVDVQRPEEKKRTA